MSDELTVILEFPNLGREKKFQITSPQTWVYNCIAWAAGDDERWWWPDKSGSAYWPKGIPREQKLDAFIDAYRTLGYELCDNANFESGFEKVAIFTKPAGTPTHAARQLPNGSWTSKLGSRVDIVHEELAGVECATYGKAAVFLKRSSSLRA